MTSIINVLKKEFDDKCQKIITYMLMRDVFEPDKLRFNQLYREIKTTYEISKPTFNEHIKHLTDRKIVTREKSGPQIVHLYLNTDHLMVENAKNMKVQLDQDLKLFEAMKNKRFWADFPTFLSHYFALCNLRRTKLLIKNYLTPEKCKENLLAITLQATLQEKLTLDLLEFVDSLSSIDEKKSGIRQILTSMDKAIVETKSQMLKLSKSER